MARCAGGVEVVTHGSALADGEGELPNLLPPDRYGRDGGSARPT